jgi:hypothetical protein
MARRRDGVLLAAAAALTTVSTAACGRSSLDAPCDRRDAGIVAADRPDGDTGAAATADAAFDATSDETVDAPSGCAPWPLPADGWVELTGPPGLDGGVATAAWAAGTDDVFFAVGGRVVRWTRGCWRVELGAGGGFAWVSGTAPDDVWATVSGAVYHRDAAGWGPPDDRWRAQIEVPGRTTTSGVHYIQPWRRDEVWATGLADGRDFYEGSSNFGPNGFALRWTSRTWRAFNVDDIVPTHVAGLDFYCCEAMTVTAELVMAATAAAARR